MSAQVAARHELICVHFKAKAGSISLCKDVEVQLSPEIRVAINTQNPQLGVKSAQMHKLTLVWVLPELETPSGDRLHLYLCT